MAACNVTALAAAAAAQARDAYNATLRPPPDCATPVLPPSSYERLVLAQAVARGDPLAASAIVDALLAAQWDDGLMPHLVYDAPPPPAGGANCTAPNFYPPPGVWGNTTAASGGDVGVPTSGLAAPPLHAAAALEVFYRWYGGATDADAALFPATGAATDFGGQATAAVAWLRTSWDSLYAWHAWLWRNRVVGGDPQHPPLPAAARASHGSSAAAPPTNGLLVSLAPHESAAPWTQGWLRALARAPNVTGSHGCTTAAPALAAVPPAVGGSAGFPGADAYARAWCQAGCAVDCGYDAACVAATCPLPGFVSVLDNALFALDSDALNTIALWLASEGAALTPVPPAQAADAAAWRGLTAQALVDSAFLFNGENPSVAAVAAAQQQLLRHRRRRAQRDADGAPAGGRRPAAAAVGDVPCAGWVYDGALTRVNATTTAGASSVVAWPPAAPAAAAAPTASPSPPPPPPLVLTLLSDTAQGHAAAALGVTLPSEQVSATQAVPGQRAAGDGEGGGQLLRARRRPALTSTGSDDPVCPGVGWRDAVVATLLSPSFEAYPLVASLSRTDARYAPADAFAGPVWLDGNARVAWGLANAINSDAAVRTLLAGETQQLLCDAASVGARRQEQQQQQQQQPAVIAPPAVPPFAAAYNGALGYALPNATAAYGAGALLAPAWALLLLAPSPTPVPLPVPFYGQSGLVAVMITELVFVMLAAGACVVLGARQVRRLQLQVKMASAASAAGGGGGGVGPDDFDDGGGPYKGRGSSGSGSALDEGAGRFAAPLLGGQLTREATIGGGSGSAAAAPVTPPKGRAGSVSGGLTRGGSFLLSAADGVMGSLRATAVTAAATAMAQAARVSRASRRRSANGGKLGVRFADEPGGGEGGDAGSAAGSWSGGGALFGEAGAGADYSVAGGSLSDAPQRSAGSGGGAGFRPIVLPGDGIPDDDDDEGGGVGVVVGGGAVGGGIRGPTPVLRPTPVSPRPHGSPVGGAGGPAEAFTLGTPPRPPTAGGTPLSASPPSAAAADGGGGWSLLSAVAYIPSTLLTYVTGAGDGADGGEAAAHGDGASRGTPFAAAASAPPALARSSSLGDTGRMLAVVREGVDID